MAKQQPLKIMYLSPVGNGDWDGVQGNRFGLTPLGTLRGMIDLPH